MKILVIGSAVPYRQHNQPGVTAVNIVLYEFLKGINQLGHEIVLQLLFNEYRSTTSLSASEENELSHLSGIGIKVLPPIYAEQYLDRARTASRLRKLYRLLKFLGGKVYVEDFYPAVNVQAMMRERVHSTNPHAILTIWSPEGVAATYKVCEQPKIAYQGDVDFAPGENRLREQALFSTTVGHHNGNAIHKLLNALRQWYQLTGFRRAHLTLMHDVDVIANVTACNADYYCRQGHPKSIYVRNTWSDPGFKQLSFAKYDPKATSSGHTIKIIGHVGYLNRTGSIYGLKFLLVDLIPRLEKIMDGLDYQIHIIGGGEIPSTLKPYLRHEQVTVRGYVNDLDQELLSSDIFLLLNNAGSYHAAYTRHIVAWAMGLCLIVHVNSREAIPEISHMENALVGSTPDEVAKMIYLAATNHEVNLRIRRGGRATYERYFTPRVVAEALLQEIERVVSGARVL